MTGSDIGERLAAVTPAIDMHAHPPYDPALREPMLQAAWKAGIARILLAQLSATSMIPYPSSDDVRRGNQVVYDLVTAHPGRVFGYVYVNPNLPDAMEIIEDGLARPGVVGIKLWISCRDPQGRLDPVFPVLDLAERRGVPVLIHAFDRTGGNEPGELAPSDIARLAQFFPRCRIVMAHLGGQWVTGIRAIAPYENVWTDFSGSRAYMGSVELAVRELGARRVLFGSDAFIRSFVAMLGKVVGADITPEERRWITWDNSASLFFGEKGEDRAR